MRSRPLTLPSGHSRCRRDESLLISVIVSVKEMRTLSAHDDEAPSAAARQWIPGSAAATLINIAGLLVVPAGFALYFTLWAGGRTAGGGSFDIVQLLLGIAVTLALIIALLIIHEAMHAAAMRVFSARPQLGVTWMGGILPAVYCIAPGARFSQLQYLAVALAPLVIVGGGCAITVAVVPFGGWLVLPAAVHLAGCVGDVALAFTAVRQPAGTRIEELPAGLQFTH